MISRFKLFRKPQAAGSNRRQRRLGLETMESRQLMTINPGFGDEIQYQPDELAPAESIGSITYNSAKGEVTANGSDAHQDRVTLIRDGKGTLTFSDDTLKVYVSNLDSPLMAEFKYTDVKRVFVNTYGGNDTIDNKTGVPMTANAGRGLDVLLGGYGGDSLLGGDDDDYLDGRGGSDYLYGENGFDALFGDDGIDSLFGGANDDRLFGGNDDDYLYGELGNDKLYGAAGADKLTDPAGTNTLYTDYGPDYSISASGFTAFDWFDKNLADPSLRSLARLEHRDGVLNRQDMLTIYTTVAVDGTVSQNELNDLKDLVSTRVNMQQDTRWYSTQIAMGSPANAHYQGTTLGNLTAGSADRLNKLVDKWFKGGDLPAIAAGAQYRRVSGELFQNGVSYTDVMQGGTGDCYLMAALGEVAQHQPSVILNMFAYNGDDTWSVRFMQGGQARYVTVNRMLPLSGLTAQYAGWGGDMQSQGANAYGWWNPGNELWVALIEKAYAQLNEQGWIGQDGTNNYHGIEGGSVRNAFSHLTGTTATDHGFGAESDFINALNAGKAMTVSTLESPPDGKFVSNHAYMVIGYDAATRTFQLFNPWGYTNQNNTQVTELSVTWAELRANFDKWTSAWV